MDSTVRACLDCPMVWAGGHHICPDCGGYGQPLENEGSSGGIFIPRKRSLNAVCKVIYPPDLSARPDFFSRPLKKTVSNRRIVVKRLAGGK